jgi:hypothetical protein
VNLSFLHPLYAVEGPFASVYLDTSWNAEDPGHAIALRWRAQHQALAQQGADEATLAALDAAVGRATGVPGEHGHVLFAAGGRVVLEHLLPHTPRRPTARWSTLPHSMPLVMQLSETVPYVVVLADRVGADITAYGPDGAGPTEVHVEGEREDITKRRPGGYAGWSQRRYQRRAENVWEHNAKLVGEQVEELVNLTGARVLAVAGDVRARAALRDHLSKRSLSILTEIESSARAPGADGKPVLRRVRELLAGAAAVDRQEGIARFERERGQHDRAVEGLTAVAAALRRAQVDVLLIRDDPTSTAALWAGQKATDLGVDAADVADQPVQERADATIVRALAGTGGSLLAVPGEMTEQRLPLSDGVGALLRYVDAGTGG